MKKLLLISLLSLVVVGCATSSIDVGTAEWYCSNGKLSEYESRTKDEYLKIKCRG